MNTKYLFSIIILLSSILCYGQRIESGTITSSSIMSPIMQSSLGELNVQSHSSGSNYLTEGFHQGELLMSSIDSPSSLDYEISIYPNPSVKEVNFIGLKEILEYRILSVDGKIIVEGQVSPASQSIMVDHLLPGVFILSLSDKRNHQNNYKIIKS